MIREVVTIDEELCDGCGLCVPACHEGALRIVDGKARLVSDRLCDGLGACLGHCPRDAIRIERRDADAFDEQAVAAATSAAPAPAHAQHAHVHEHGGCPGSRLMQFDRTRPAPCAGRAGSTGEAQSELTHWPVQLRLLSPTAPVLRGASLLVAADCVPVAYAGFHGELLRGRTVVIGCPKFDDLESYVERLTEMLRQDGLREVLVARMEVPCCSGIVAAVVEARRRAGVGVPIEEVVVGVDGEIRTRRALPADAAA